MKKSGNLSVGLVFDDSLDSSDGVSQYVKTVGAWLSQNGHQVAYIVGQSKTETWSGGQVVSAARNLNIRWGGNYLSVPVWPDRAKIKAVIREQKFDVLHVQVPYSPLMSQYVINQADAETALIGTFHVYPGNRMSRAGARLLKLVYGRSLKRFDRMLSVSPAAAQFAKAGFNIDSQILPNVVELKRFQTAGQTHHKNQRIVFLGRLVKRKGCLELLKAFVILQTKLPDADLVIAGDGPLRSSLETYVKQHGLSDKVSFLGFIKEDDKPSLLSSADIACFPSLFGESFGIVLIEAMAAGAGVVLAGDNPGYRSVLNQQPQLLIDPTNTTLFADRLEKLLSKKIDVEELHNWQTAAVRQYDIETVGPELVKIYRQRIAKRSKKSNN